MSKVQPGKGRAFALSRASCREHGDQEKARESCADAVIPTTGSVATGNKVIGMEWRVAERWPTFPEAGDNAARQGMCFCVRGEVIPAGGCLSD